MSWRDSYFPVSTPRLAEGGIKAKGGRQLGGERWWAKRWVAVLESFDLGARLGRGRSYARKGQVLAVEIGPGLVTAQVQGSRRTPTRSRSSWPPCPRTRGSSSSSTLVPARSSRPGCWPGRCPTRLRRSSSRRE